MGIVLAILILTAAPPVLDLTDHVDIIELNHVIDANGCESFSQWIFWEWSSTRKRYQVVAWRLASSNNVRPKGELVELRFMDGAQSRVIQAVSYRETWTRGDPEVVDREWLRREDRRGLSRAEVATLGHIDRPAAWP